MVKDFSFMFKEPNEVAFTFFHAGGCGESGKRGQLEIQWEPWSSNMQLSLYKKAVVWFRVRVEGLF